MTDSNNQPESFEPVAEQHIDNVETLRVISNGLRGRILDRLRAEPLTVKQLAGELGLSPKKLYYHINLMEQHSLIRVVQTRLVSGILEKTYRATAYLFQFENPVFATAASESNIPPGISLLFDATRNQLDQSIEQGQVRLDAETPAQGLLLRWQLNQLSPERAAAFYERLAALVDEYMDSAPEPANSESQAYRLFLAFFPVRGHRQQTKPPDANNEK